MTPSSPAIPKLLVCSVSRTATMSKKSGARISSPPQILAAPICSRPNAGDDEYLRPRAQILAICLDTHARWSPVRPKVQIELDQPVRSMTDGEILRHVRLARETDILRLDSTKEPLLYGASKNVGHRFDPAAIRHPLGWGIESVQTKSIHSLFELFLVCRKPQQLAQFCDRLCHQTRALISKCRYRLAPVRIV